MTVARVSHKDFFNAPAVQQKLAEVVSGNSKQFTASLLSVVNNNSLLAKADSNSIMTAAMKAAVLNLPIEPSLGFAYIVPYKNQAQFQIGYRGLIQLAIRSGQVKNINAGVIYASQFVSYDPIFEELKLDLTKPATGDVAGYFASLELTNGFRKMTYWTLEQVTAHGKRFSKTFTSGPWKTDFDAMAQKTLLKDLISKYAPLSTDMQEAVVADNATENVTRSTRDVTGTTDQDILDNLLAEGPSEEGEQPPIGVDAETGEIMDGEQGALFKNLAEVTS